MKKLVLIVGALVLFGCAGQEALKHGQEMIEAGNEEQGLARLEEAMKANPNDAEIRNYYLRHKAVAVQRYLQMGETRAPPAPTTRPRPSFQRALRFDADNANAKAGLQAVARERAQRSAGQGSRRGDDARRYAERARQGPGSPEAPSDRSATRAPSCARSRSRRSRPTSPARSSPRR